MSKRYALITGASGLLGTLVNTALQQRGLTTIGLAHRTRPATDIIITDLSALKQHTDHLEVIVNLAGLPIMGKPWTARYKAQLRDSRIGLTQRLRAVLSDDNIRCNHLVSGSAIGFYGATDQPCTEASPSGADFSARLCADWEAAAHEARDVCNHIAIIRTGLVLTETAGFLKPFKLPSALGFRLIFGDGKQWLSWIDYRDWLDALLMIVDQKLGGTFNLTAPEPVQQQTFSRALLSARSWSIPVRLPRLLFQPMGEMKILLIEGQKVLPGQLLEAGYRFRYRNPGESLADLPFPR